MPDRGDGCVGIRVLVRLLLEEREAVRFEHDDHRPAKILRTLHQQLEVAEVGSHRSGVLRLLKELTFAAAGLALHLVELNRGNRVDGAAFVEERGGHRSVVCTPAPVVSPAFREIGVAHVPGNGAVAHPRSAPLFEQADDQSGRHADGQCSGRRRDGRVTWCRKRSRAQQNERNEMFLHGTLLGSGRTIRRCGAIEQMSQICVVRRITAEPEVP